MPARAAAGEEGAMPELSVAMRYVIAAVWAMIVGGLMAGGAVLLEFSAAEVWLVGILGGLGASAYVLLAVRKSPGG
jgi:hypothetical protein